MHAPRVEQARHVGERISLRDAQRKADAALVAFARESPVTLVDPKARLCTADACRIESGGEALFRDSNHLSVAGAVYVADSLAGCFSDLR